MASIPSPFRDTITARSFDPKLRHQGRSHIGVWKGVTLVFRQSSSQGVSSDSSFSGSVITSDIGGGDCNHAEHTERRRNTEKTPPRSPPLRELRVKPLPLRGHGR